jgi:outer membrane lipoprotein-sorting protein
MSMFSSRPALRWLVPAAAVVVVIGGGAAIGTLAASAEPSLPPRSAAQLLVDVQTAKLNGLSGTVVESVDLGLPKLPDIGGVAGASGLGLASLLSGSHTVRVWHSGPDKTRIALLNTLGETDVIRNGRDMWMWDSKNGKATHTRLPEGAEGKRIPSTEELPLTPQEAADRALAAIDPSTEVTVGTNGWVAGRTAYELVLSPRDKASLVGQIRIAIDSKEHLPLRLQVFPKGSDATAIKIEFTQISFERPSDEKFRFVPPKGTTVEEPKAPEAVPDLPPDSKLRELPRKPGQKPEHKPGHKPAGPAEKKSTAVIGKGWTTVFVARVSDGSPEADIRKDSGKTENGKNLGQGAAQALEFLQQLTPVSGSWGSGKLMAGKLFSVLITNDGRLLVGAVAPERLYQVAADPAAALK